MAAVSAWTACLKDLEQLAAEPPSSPAALLVYQRLIEHWKSFETPPPLPRAALNKLVAKLKIPLKLFSACSRAEQSQPQSGLVVAAVSTLKFFLHSGVMGTFPPQTREPLSDSGSSIQADIQQQLKQSGLLQQLPALLTAAADELDKQANQPSGMPDLYKQSIVSHATQLLFIFFQILKLWPPVDPAAGVASLAVAAGSAPAAVRLALSARHYVSSRLRQAEQGLPAGAGLMLSLLEAADNSISALIFIIRSVAVPIPGVLSRVPETKQLFLSPHFMPCLMVVIATLATRQLLTPGTGPTGGANSSSSTTTTTSSSRPGPSRPSSSQARVQPRQQWLSASGQGRVERAEAVKAWQQACSNQSRLTATHRKLFDSLGVDSRTALWAAGVPAELSGGPYALATLVAVYTNTQVYWEHFHQVWQGVDPHAHLWLAAVVLQCAARMPADSMEHVECYETACVGVKSTINCWRCSTQPPCDNPRASDDTAELQPQQVLAQPVVRQQPAHILLPPAEFVSEVLPLILTLFSQLQVSLAAFSDIGPASVSASALLADKSKRSSRATYLPATSESKVHAMTKAVSSLYWLLLPVMSVHTQLADTYLAGAQITATATATSTVAAGSAGTIKEMGAGQQSHTAAEQSYLALFQVHLLQLMICIEGAVRCVMRTATSAASSMACDHTLIAVSYMCHGDTPGAGSQGPLLIMARAAGPGSPEQRQLYSLLSSMLKLRHSSIAGVQRAAQFCCMAAAANAAALLSQPAGGSREAEADFEGLAGRTSADAGDSSTKAVHADLPLVLPSLFIFGCCCLQWAEQLRQEIPSQLLQTQADAGQQAASKVTRLVLDTYFSRPTGELTCSASELCFSPIQHADGLSPVLLCWLHAVGGWLQSSNTSAQLASAGYDPEQLLQQLNGPASALHTAIDNSADPAALLEFVQQLHGLGVALSSVATPHACNNPNCRNVSGPSERQLVSGRSCMCAGCRTARYCSKACQQQHWKQHKPTCKALAAAKAAAAVAD